MKLTPFVRRFLWIAVVLFAADWVLGALIVERLLPWWLFPALNPPTGLLYSWFESHWTGTQYRFNGQVVSELFGMAILPIVAMSQAALYASIWAGLSHLRRHPPPADPRHTAARPRHT